MRTMTYMLMHYTMKEKATIVSALKSRVMMLIILQRIILGVTSISR